MRRPGLLARSWGRGMRAGGAAGGSRIAKKMTLVLRKPGGATSRHHRHPNAGPVHGRNPLGLRFLRRLRLARTVAGDRLANERLEGGLVNFFSFVDVDCAALGYSRRLTRLCSPQMTQRPPEGGDDNALSANGLAAVPPQPAWNSIRALVGQCSRTPRRGVCFRRDLS